jgi:hypothetical protein
MPMSGSLTQEEITAVREWIDDGAHWDAGPATTGATELAINTELPPGAREFWSFQLPIQAELPDVADFEHPIDRFLEQTRQDNGLTAAPRADQRTLLRRAYLDLTGLPPTSEQTAAFLADTDPGAWERLIDQLLASPHYGERWGRHWLDVARYADSDGFGQDADRTNAWRYRDYVIDAFNKDKPYNQFLIEQIAGDELDETTYESRIATGFLRAGPRLNYREKDNPERRYDYLDDVIATLGRGVLGLTVQCARCHDHKFDPILQKDYYSLEASIFGYVEVEYPLLPEDQAHAYRRLTAAIDEMQRIPQEQIEELEAPYLERMILEVIERDFPEEVLQAVLTPENQRTAGQRLLAAQVLTPRTLSISGISASEIERRLAEEMTPEDLARRQVLLDLIEAADLERPEEPAMAEIVTDGDYRYTPDRAGDNVLGCPECRIKMEEPGTFLHEGPGRYEVPPSHFLIRGDPFSLGPEMSPGFVTVATYGNPPTEIPRANGLTSGRRLALAQWLTSPQNPLPTRVWVNRLWHHHFGRGIVSTLDNFGKIGDPPTHPELLDWLAVEFRNRGWSAKEMHRLIMTSDAYQMASEYENPDNLANDVENHLLWRFRPQRLEAEAIRDVIMATSGGIDLTIGGQPIFPYVPEEILSLVHENDGRWDNQPDGPHAWRRSVYVYRRRTLSYPFFNTFDLPDQNVTSAGRNTSTVATQSLTLLNNPFVLGQARLFAEQLEEEAPNDIAQQINLAYLRALTRPPTNEEAAIARQLVEERSLEDLTHVLFNVNEFLYLR